MIETDQTSTLAVEYRQSKRCNINTARKDTNTAILDFTRISVRRWRVSIIHIFNGNWFSWIIIRIYLFTMNIQQLQQHILKTNKTNTTKIAQINAKIIPFKIQQNKRNINLNGTDHFQDGCDILINTTEQRRIHTLTSNRHISYEAHTVTVESIIK
jgi:hypothetical protein